MLKISKIILRAWRLHTVCVGFTLLCAFSFLGTTLSEAQKQKKQGNLYRFLKEDMEFSRKDFRKMKEGQVVTKLLETNVKHEVAVFSVARINVPKEFYVRNYDKDEMNIETAYGNPKGRFSNPTEMGDIQALSLPPNDLKDLAKCEPGRCNVKLPGNAFEKLRQLKSSSSDFDVQANILFRQAIVSYVQNYLNNGNAVLVEYHDKENPIRLIEEFKGLIEESPYLYKYAPQLLRYLEGFPNTKLSNTKDVFYWLKENLGGKTKAPIISIIHDVFYRPEGAVAEVVISKLLYATHYFEASLGLTLMIDEPEGNKEGFYLICINRSRIDFLRKIPGFLSGKLFKKVHNIVHKKMTIVKKNIEEAYQAKY